MAPLQIFLAVAVVAALCACLLLCWQRFRIRRLLKQLDEMLEQAVRGSFHANSWQESQLSRLEMKLVRFLQSSQLSQRMVSAERDKVETLLSDISHQTKTPLANILLYTQLLAERPELNVDCRALVEQIGQQGEKLSFLIETLLKTSQLENGILQLRPKAQNLIPMLDAVCQEYQAKAQAKGVALSWRLPEEQRAVFDRKWTAEAIANLLDNGIKYTPAGGCVQVSLEPYELFCRIDVADTGIGVREEEWNQIFGRFYRSPEVSDMPGVGIGLYLTREILAAQGGYIKVASTLGRGAVFSCFLPQQQP